MDSIDFEHLKKLGKTVIYKELKSETNEGDWDFWGERKTQDEHVYVYRKIVTFEEAKQYVLENDILN